MATSLKLVFNTALGETVTHSYAYADPEATSQQIASLSSVIIANGSLFATTPISLKSAKLVTTTETDVTPQA